MPIYEYRCPSCHRVFEQLVPMNAPAPPCPDCGGEKTVRLISLFAAARPSVAEYGGNAPSSASCCGGHCGCRH